MEGYKDVYGSWRGMKMFTAHMGGYKDVYGAQGGYKDVYAAHGEGV